MKSPKYNSISCWCVSSGNIAAKQLPWSPLFESTGDSGMRLLNSGIGAQFRNSHFEQVNAESAQIPTSRGTLYYNLFANLCHNLYYNLFANLCHFRASSVRTNSSSEQCNLLDTGIVHDP